MFLIRICHTTGKRIFFGKGSKKNDKSTMSLLIFHPPMKGQLYPPPPDGPSMHLCTTGFPDWVTSACKVARFAPIGALPSSPLVVSRCAKDAQIISAVVTEKFTKSSRNSPIGSGKSTPLEMTIYLT
ncbi:similar to DNA-dependent RNA polymerase beta subunit [Rhodopirellula baltica SH 1]|uniref:Similar to DNA-dependent RNA polymerase beta subunit n=1 Tax=Rhodopirellula baltica (strain DSM 10527 / NCIMB 13988 / SH1) TaxID=243090 RepID=Q7UVB6_RHOBA|nr:similar to DNA-dependent RNA polymerase beta subunit [Rhodopirellula baltica SH 1]